jgi:GAF domain-containing protein
MLADADREWLSVVASRGVAVSRETMSPRKVGEGASGICFTDGKVLCVPDVDVDERFAGRAAGEYESEGFAVVPLICLGVPVGVLCLTEGEDPDCLSLEETSVLRLLGMQISEFLAADPEVERLLATASATEVEGVMSLDLLDGAESRDGDGELAREVCEAVAAEVEPERVMRSALGAVAQRLGAAPVSLYLQSSEGQSLDLEAQVDAGVVGDRSTLPVDRGLTGGVFQTGQLIASPAPRTDPRFDAAVDTADDGQPRPMLCVSIKLRENRVGVLRVFLAEGSLVSPRTAEILGAAFSAAVRNILLYRSLLQSIEEVAEARRNSRI